MTRGIALSEENETLEVHTLADDIDLLLEGFMDRICKATGRTREELQRELEMVELEEETQLESASDEKSTTITNTTTGVALAEDFKYGLARIH